MSYSLVPAGKAGDGDISARKHSGSASAVLPYKTWTYQCDVDEELVFERKDLPAIRGAAGQLRHHTEHTHVLPSSLLDEDDLPPTGPLKFVAEPWFQCMTGVVIFANCIIIGLETDYGDAPCWWWVEQCLLIYFVGELTLRMCQAGFKFWKPDVRFGNLIDVLIVLCGVADMWMSPLAAWLRHANNEDERGDGHTDKLKVIIGLSRMLRIVRLVRLVKIVPPLYILAKGIMEAMQGMFWVLIFLLLCVYAIAIVLTRLIGQRVVLNDVSDEALEVADMFNSIFGSMFVLFEMMSCWSLMGFATLFEVYPCTRVIAVVFYIITAWALLAVMTGVVSEKMLAVRDSMNEEDKVRAAAKLQVATEILHELFAKADSDGSMNIDVEEFQAMLTHPDTVTTLRSYTSVTVEDLEDLFNWLDKNSDGSLSIQEFMDGFSCLNEEFSQKSILKMHGQLTKGLINLERRLLGQIEEPFERFFKAVQDPVRKILVITQQIQRVDMILHGHAERLKQASVGRLKRRHLEQMEARLTAKIAALEQAVCTLDDLEAAGFVKIAGANDLRTMSESSWVEPQGG